MIVRVTDHKLGSTVESGGPGDGLEDGNAPDRHALCYFPERLIGESDQIISKSTQYCPNDWAYNINPKTLVDLHDHCRPNAPSWVHRRP